VAPFACVSRCSCFFIAWPWTGTLQTDKEIDPFCMCKSTSNYMVGGIVSRCSEPKPELLRPVQCTCEMVSVCTMFSTVDSPQPYITFETPTVIEGRCALRGQKNKSSPCRPILHIAWHILTAFIVINLGTHRAICEIPIRILVCAMKFMRRQISHLDGGGGSAVVSE
jgi:hypothetical protein